MKRYQIGNFAKFLGVQAGHLKHYSKGLLLSPDYAENGYRFYSFKDAPKMIHLMFLRAFGFNLKDAESIMKAPDYPKIERLIRKQRCSIELDIKRQQAAIGMLDEIEDAYALAQTHKGIIRRCSPVYVHVNADRQGFIESDELIKTTAELSDNMPLVTSCAFIPFEDRTLENLKWGLCIDTELADRFSVNTSGCTLIPERDCFVYAVYAEAEYGTIRLSHLFGEAFDSMREQGLTPGKNIISKSYLQSNYNTHNILLFQLFIPIE